MTSSNIVKLDKVFNADIWIDSPEWIEWLAQCSSFRYEGKSTSFNCTKRHNGKWYGSKKIYSSTGSKAVSLYIGSACSLEKLQQIEYYFSLDWKDFWKWYYSDERKQPKAKVVQPTACTTNSNDLKAEVEQLRAALEQVTADRDRQLIRIAELQNRMHSELQSGFSEKDKRIQELDDANWQLEKRYDTLNEMWRKSEQRRTELQAENDTLKAELANCVRSSVTTLDQPDQPQPTEPSHHWVVGDTFKSRAWIKTQFRLSDRKSREDEIKAPDGSLWRRLSEKQSAEFAKRLSEKPNTIYYKCVG